MSRKVTTTRTVYTFDELDDKGKDRVREWWSRVQWQDGWAAESMEAIWRDTLEAAGWSDLSNLTYSDLYSQGGYPVWDGELEAFEDGGYRWTVTVRANRSGSYFASVDVEPECVNDEDEGPSDDEVQAAREAAHEHVRGLSGALFWKFRAEDEYLSSEEQVAESCEANGYEFTEDGELA